MGKRISVGLFIFWLLIVATTSGSALAGSSKTLNHDSERLEEIQGEILRLYEDRGSEWGSYILIRDLYGDEKTIFVHPALTLVRHNGQTLEMHQITGGMKARIIYQKPYRREARAVSIIVSGIFYG